MSLPTVNEVRDRIESIVEEDIRNSVKTAYLYAGRISEVIGHASPSDKTVARGPTGSDTRLDVIAGHEAVLFSVRTAKRQGIERIIALPTDFEPWAKPLYKYFQEAGTNKVFPFTRQKVSQHTRKVFKGFDCPIEKYRIIHTRLEKTELDKYRGWEKIEDKQSGLFKVVWSVIRHTNPFTLHSLRHLRATELRRFYHFKGDELAAYCGWRLGTVEKVSRVMERYQDLSMDYLEYFPKLLKVRN